MQNMTRQPQLTIALHRASDQACVIALVLMLFTLLPTQAEPLRVAADQQSITLHLGSNIKGQVRVFALAAHETHDPTDPPIYAGPAHQTIRLKRHSNHRDLLFCRWILQTPDNKTLAGPAWVSDTTTLPANNHPMPWPKQIKGVSNPEDFDDLVTLGVRHVHVNFNLRTLLLPEKAPDPPAEFIRQVNGARVRLNPATIRAWDKKIKRMTDDGINVVAVLLNGFGHQASNTDPLIHPQTDLQDAPHKLGAFSLASDLSIALYTGTIGFLAQRYSHEDKRFGWIGGYIIGNEVDSHWVWHNMGPADLETVASHYIQEVRLAWLAIREQAQAPSVFISLTHSWARPNAMDPKRSLAGKQLLNRLTELSRQQGDFDWHVAYHPYPQNLFEPRFWDDRMAMFGYDSPMITFKNIEMLPAYLDKPEMHVRGKPRRVILSEQGLHTPKGPDGETIQAAALALAMHRVKHTPGIDAFILHRHVDSRNEGGLLLGLRHPRDQANRMIGEKKRSWHIFQQFETAQWEDAAAFALPIAGYENWQQALPKAGPFPEQAPEWANTRKHDNPIADMAEQLGSAIIENALACRQKIVNLPDGGFVQAILLHPKRPGAPGATATYTIELPQDREAELVFQTYRDKPQGDGVVYRVRVNGKLLFQKTVEDQAMQEHRVDLATYAGQTIKLTLEVDPRRNNSHDSAYWLNPAIIEQTP